MADAQFLPSASWRRGPAEPNDATLPLRNLPKAPRLPAPRNSFVGRADDIEAIVGLLDKHAVVTLTGPGGSGKTRLAVAVAEAAGDRFPDGAWFVDLTAVAEAHLVAPAVAKLLGLPEWTEDRGGEELVDHLAQSRLLLVLDNCEQVIDGAASLADLLASGCDHLRVLATSRERLAIAAEAAYPVSPLPLPDGMGAGLAEIENVPSVRLFIDRATAANARVALTDADAPALVEICTRLDGLPLALELAAARMATMSAADIASGLDNHFELLGHGFRTAVPRQRTLKGAVDWSHELLDESERAVLRRLAVFAGAFTLEAGQAVAAAPPVKPSSVTGLIDRLVDQSLVVAASGHDGRQFRLLETIRQFGCEKLVEMGEFADAKDRHMAWFAAQADGIYEAFDHDPSTTSARCVRDHDNYRAAIEWSSSDPSRRDAGLCLARDVFIFWYFTGITREGIHWMKRALDGAPPSGLTAAVTRRAAILAYDLCQPDEAVALCTEAAAMAEDTDRAEFGRALALLGGIWVNRGELDRAEPLLSQGLTIAREGDEEDWAAANCMGHLGWLAHRRGDYAQARRWARRLAACDEGNQWNLAASHELLGGCDYAEESWGQAVESYRAMLAAGTALDSPEMQACAWEGIGAGAAAAGDGAEARRAYDQAVAISVDKPDILLLAAWAGLGELAAGEGRYDEARILAVREVEMARRRDDAYMLGWALARLGAGRAAAGDKAGGRIALDEALAIGTRCGMPWIIALVAASAVPSPA